MFELLGLVGGAVARLLPMVFTFFKEGRDLKYELLRMDKEAELEKLRAKHHAEEAAAANQFSLDGKWADGLVEALKGQSQVTGDKWLDRINVSVRPVLTYWWCIVMYTMNKVLLMYVGIKESLPLKDLSPILYTDFDSAVVGSIIGFWFVDRALRKSRG